MDKLEYYLNQFHRTRNKAYENYCIERIINKLDNDQLQFVTQQMFRRSDNRIALADLYFPQIKMSVEVDEAYHKNNKEQDELREKEVRRAMELMETIVPFEPEVLRINASTHSLGQINREIDCVVEKIKDRMQAAGELKWDLIENPAQICLSRGYISEEDSFEFRTIKEVSDLFGKNYSGMQRCFFPVKDKKENVYVWCPKLHLDAGEIKVPYENTISLDGSTIFESSKEGNEKFVAEMLTDKNQSQIRYAFPYYKTASGGCAYVYKGKYTLDVEKTKLLNKRVWVKSEESRINLTCCNA